MVLVGGDGIPIHVHRLVSMETLYRRSELSFHLRNMWAEADVVVWEAETKRWSDSAFRHGEVQMFGRN